MKKNSLHKIAPKLIEISPSATGFSIPDGYFQSIEDAVFSKLKAESFSQSNNNSSFSIPSNYFETVEDIVITKLKAESIQEENSQIPDNYFDSVEPKVFEKIHRNSNLISLKNNVIKILIPFAVAASLLLIFILKTNASKVTFDSLANDDIEQFIENDLISINTENIATAFPEIELTTDFIQETISNDELLNYLNRENIEELLYEN